jgi:imidazolonepropionase-like amidohydrolase
MSSTGIALLSVLVVKNVTLIDAVTPPRSGWTVRIEDGSIDRLGPANEVPVPAGAQVLDAAGGFLIPGLWDMHGHLSGYPSALHLLIGHGVTGVRDMGDAPKESSREIEDWRREIDAGRRIGPRIVAAGPTLDGPRGVTSPGRLLVSGPGDVTAALSTLRSRGGTFAKIHDWFSRDAYFALMRAARAAGVPVAGHVPASVTALEATEAGQVSIEHLGSALGGLSIDASSREAGIRAELLARMREARESGSEAGLWQWATQDGWLEKLVSSGDPARAEALVDAFRRHGTWHCPTLVVLSPRLPPRDASAGRYVFRSAAALCRDPASPEPMASTARQQIFARQLAFVAELQRGEVGLLTGSDFGRPDRAALEEFGRCDVPLAGLSVHEELAWLVEAGLGPMDALAAATTGPARFFGEADTSGRIEAAQRADLVLLDANPLDDIRNTRRIRAVIRAGRLLDRPALDALLSTAAADARSH